MQKLLECVLSSVTILLKKVRALNSRRVYPQKHFTLVKVRELTETASCDGNDSDNCDSEPGPTDDIESQESFLWYWEQRFLIQVVQRSTCGSHLKYASRKTQAAKYASPISSTQLVPKLSLG